MDNSGKRNIININQVIDTIGYSKQAFIINPYTSKVISLGQPYVFQKEDYYSLNLVSEALTVHDNMGVELSLNNTGGIFYACATGDSSVTNLGEEFTFTYPKILLSRQDNTIFKTTKGDMQLLCHTKKAASDYMDCFAYVSLKEIARYMTKDGYFTDFSDDGAGVWSFEENKPSVDILYPKNGDCFNVGNILSVKARIKNVNYANLSIGAHSERRENIGNQSPVTFNDYTLTDNDIGNLTIKVDVGNISSSVLIRVEGAGSVYANDGTDINRLSHEEQLANANYIYNYLKDPSQGWSTKAICGLFGNMQRESHFNPGVWQNKDLVRGTKTKGSGYGLVQWTPSGEKFLDWAGFTGTTDQKTADNANYTATNDPKRLMDMQLEYLIYSSLSSTPSSSVHRQWYATTGYGSPQKMTYEQYIVSALTAGDLALVFHGSYERSDDTSTIKQERKDNANRWYDYFTKGTVSDDLFK